MSVVHGDVCYSVVCVERDGVGVQKCVWVCVCVSCVCIVYAQIQYCGARKFVVG